MGSTIATGLERSKIEKLDITVSDPSEEKLAAISQTFPQIKTTSDNVEAIKDANMVLFAVKPWVLPLVAETLKNIKLPSIIISIVAGCGTERLEEMFGKDKTYFYVIPNTALSTATSMTFVTSRNETPEASTIVRNIFSSMGKVAFIEERLMSAATALSSCGIAYAFKYVQACIQAGVQLGFTPKDAQDFAVTTVQGAMSMLEKPGAIPQTEIDRVTTPGGMTIKGINKLEETGFTSSIIQSILAPLKK